MCDENTEMVEKLPWLVECHSNTKKQDITNTSHLVKKVNLILNELKVKKIYALLIHNPQILKLDKKKKIYKSLIEMKKKGKIHKLGISIYNLEEINFALKKFKFNIIQLPINLFDRKFINNGILSLCFFIFFK